METTLASIDDPWMGDASWVWEPEAAPSRNVYVAFRLAREWVDGPTAGTDVQISASSLYRLYVNGSYLGRGPVREWPGHVGVDRYDIGPHLKPGRNIISAIVHHYGDEVGGYPLAPPGFLLQGSIGGPSVSTGTAPWQCCRLGAWNSDSPRSSLYVGFNEDVDMRQWSPDPWTTGGDDGAWTGAAIVKDARVHWPHAEPRLIPLLRERLLDSPRLVRAGEYRPSTDPGLSWAQQMGAEAPVEARAQRLVEGGRPWPVRVTPGPPAYLLLDVGRLTAGALEIDVAAAGDEELRIGYADRLSDGVFTPDHGGVNNAVDRLILKPGSNPWQSLFNLRGFRYVKFCLSELRAPVEFRQVRVREITYPADTRARFHCSDDRLNRMWEASRLTTRLCMSDTFMDNPSRERQQYGGDGYLQALYAWHFFGDAHLWRQFLRQYAQGRRPDGAIQSGGPWCWNQIIPAWTLLWIESVAEYTHSVGDASVLREHADAIQDALAWFPPMIDRDGLLTIEEKWGWCGKPGGVLWNFIDWQGHGEQLRGEAARLTLNGLYAHALETAAGLLRRVGREQPATECDRQRTRLVAALEPAVARQPGEHAIAAATLAGAIRGRMADIADRVRGGKAESDIMFLFFTLKALEREGHDAAALDFIRAVFGPMLDDGESTFYETRQARSEPSRALCQGIGGVAGYFLPRLVAGVRDIDAEARTVDLRAGPVTADGAEVTLPAGDDWVTVETRVEQGSVRMDAKLPRGWRRLRS